MVDSDLKYLTKESIIYRVIKTIAYVIYSFAFIFVSFGVFQECQAEHHVWIVANILNGITGGVLLVYPFNKFRLGWGELLENWIGFFFIFAFLTATALVIGGCLGFGGM